MSSVAMLSTAAACLALFSGVGGAYAQSQRINYGDLNLLQVDDAMIFSHRVDVAGNKLCREIVTSGRAGYQGEWRSCVQAVREEAYAALPPALSADMRTARGNTRTGM